jgi:pilus assembly protein Flp/PilA
LPRKYQVSSVSFVSLLGRRFHSLETGLTVSLLMKNLSLKLRSLRETNGQDLIEYALMAGFVAVTAGAIMPGVASSISTIFSQVGSVMVIASTQG